MVNALAHKARVQRLYKRCFKEFLNWGYQREYFYEAVGVVHFHSVVQWLWVAFCTLTPDSRRKPSVASLRQRSTWYVVLDVLLVCSIARVHRIWCRENAWQTVWKHTSTLSSTPTHTLVRAAVCCMV